jgi:hypothetical protein
VMTAAQSRAPGRLVTLNPFELGASSREGLEAASPAEIGARPAPGSNRK